ncbi:hypothetical protein TRIUR3_17684 [Triticum urartu]|uniref:Phosphatidylglycerophosphatase GEP4, mitochondrial n=1 Tax=Triticum urartu TaxID=4572 RepID=M7ZCR1_TRIUA|nr:hypothetical protein TRIUR3_17684 [Triticum urartu]
MMVALTSEGANIDESEERDDLLPTPIEQTAVTHERNSEGLNLLAIKHGGTKNRERESQNQVYPRNATDIRWLDWAELRRAGFRGVVFDKDNTLTAPYAPELWPLLTASFDQCRAAFPGAIAVYSNSAGLKQYDPDGSDASTIEATIDGVHVIRHDAKKPAGAAKEIESYFDCSASDLVLVGDRYFTDVIYGNRNGFLTVFTEPLSFVGESYIVRKSVTIE